MRLTATYAVLDGGEGRDLVLDWRLRTSGGQRYGVEVRAKGALGVAHARLRDADGLRVRCPRVRARSDTARNRISARIPRRCLGTPRWVRYRAVASSYVYRGVYSDDALSDRERSGSWSPKAHAA